MTAPSRARPIIGYQIVAEERSNQSSVGDFSDRRTDAVETIIIPLYCARGWSGTAPDIYLFIVIYTKRKWSKRLRYQIDSVDYVGYPSNVPSYTKSKRDLEKAIQCGVAEHLGVDKSDVGLKRTAMWYVHENSV